MAGLRTAYKFSLLAANIVVGTNITLIQILAPTNQKIRIERLFLFGRGTLATDKQELFELLTQSTAGTGSTITPTKLNGADSETIQGTAIGTYTVEPTAGTIRQQFGLQPQRPLEVVFPPGRDLIIKGGERLALRLNTPIAAYDYFGTIEAEE